MEEYIMKKTIMLIFLMGLIPMIASAHLCNDVFVQAKDNLAVKVDIRDGQLRISKNAKFRVYLLNTMDRAIDEIRLEVVTKDFEAKVTPSPEWRRFPVLSVRKKKYFEVELTRKPGTESGKYKIALRLIGGGREFKTVNIDDALCALSVPENSQPPNIDGNISSAEWKNSFLCTSLYQYKSSGLISRYKENTPSEVQTRFRFSRYKDTLYCLIDFMEQTGNDVARIYVARDHDSEPMIIVADLQKGKAFVDGEENIRINSTVNGNRMEIELPSKVLNIRNQKSLYINLTRDYKNITTYWLGNSYSVMDPIVYANFVF
jgi:hypothetical protein